MTPKRGETGTVLRTESKKVLKYRDSERIFPFDANKQRNMSTGFKM